MCALHSSHPDGAVVLSSQLVRFKPPPQPGAPPQRNQFVFILRKRSLSYFRPGCVRIHSNSANDQEPGTDDIGITVATTAAPVEVLDLAKCTVDGKDVGGEVGFTIVVQGGKPLQVVTGSTAVRDKWTSAISTQQNLREQTGTSQTPSSSLETMRGARASIVPASAVLASSGGLLANASGLLQTMSKGSSVWVHMTEDTTKSNDISVTDSTQPVFVMGIVAEEGDLLGSVPWKVLVSGKMIAAKMDNMYQCQAGAKEEDLPCPDNLTQLSFLHDASVLKALKHRWLQRSIYTWVSSILISINPYQPLVDMMSLDNLRTFQSGGGAGLPHVWSIAQRAVTGLKEDAVDQSIIVSGESGSGKTEITKFLLRYLSDTESGCGEKSSGDNGHRIPEKLMAVNPILESFGNAKTVRNDNSSRFGKFINVEMSTENIVAGAKVQVYLLEVSRACSHVSQERSFHIFHEMQASCKAGFPGIELDDHSRSRLSRLSLPFESLSASADCARDDLREHGYFVDGLRAAGYDNAAIIDLYNVLCGLLCLNNLSFVDKQEEETGEEGCIISDDCQADAEIASDCFGIQSDSLSELLCNKSIGKGDDAVLKPLSSVSARGAVETVIKCVYNSVFENLVSSINSELKSTVDDLLTIGLLDIFGFENFENNSFEQLCINYANEKLQKLFVGSVFEAVEQEYEIEKIPWEPVDFPDNSALLELLERTRPAGILPLLHEQCVLPRGSDQTFLKKMQEMHSAHSALTFPRTAKDDPRALFTIKHSAESVQYDAVGMMERNKQPLREDLFSLLAASQSSQQLRSIFGQNKIAKKKGNVQSVGGLFRQGLSTLVMELSQRKMHFIRCFKPNDLKSSEVFNERRILEQLKSNGITQALQTAKASYPQIVPFSDFTARMSVVLGSPFAPSPSGVREIMKSIRISLKDFNVGETKVFLSQKAINACEERVQIAAKEKRSAIATYLLARMKSITFWESKLAAITLTACVKVLSAKVVLNSLMEEEARRKAEEEEARRKAEEEEARRKAEEEEARRKAEEEEARRQAEEEEARRKAEEEEARRKAEEEEARRKAEEEEARRKAEEEEARHKAEEEEARRQAEEEEARRKAEEEEARRQAEEEEARRQAEEEEARRQAEEEARRQAEEEEARRKAEEEKAKHTAEEEAKRKVVDEDPKLQAEEETQRNAEVVAQSNSSKTNAIDGNRVLSPISEHTEVSGRNLPSSNSNSAMKGSAQSEEGDVRSTNAAETHPSDETPPSKTHIADSDDKPVIEMLSGLWTKATLSAEEMIQAGMEQMQHQGSPVGVSKASDDSPALSDTTGDETSSKDEPTFIDVLSTQFSALATEAQGWIDDGHAVDQFGKGDPLEGLILKQQQQLASSPSPSVDATDDIICATLHRVALVYRSFATAEKGEHDKAAMFLRFAETDAPMPLLISPLFQQCILACKQSQSFRTRDWHGVAQWYAKLWAAVARESNSRTLLVGLKESDECLTELQLPPSPWTPGASMISAVISGPGSDLQKQTGEQKKMWEHASAAHVMSTVSTPSKWSSSRARRRSSVGGLGPTEMGAAMMAQDQICCALRFIAEVLVEQGQEKESEGVFTKCEQLRQPLLPSGHEEDALSKISHMRKFESMGGAAVAAVNVRKQLEAELGVNGLAQDYESFATVLEQEGAFEIAEFWFHHATRHREKFLGEDDPSVAVPLMGQGSALCNQGKFKAAAAKYRQAYALREQQLGQLHELTLASLRALATALEADEKFEDAIQILIDVAARMREGNYPLPDIERLETNIENCRKRADGCVMM